MSNSKQNTDFFALGKLLTELKNAGLNISPDQYNDIFQLVDQLPVPRKAEKLRFLLRAIVCKNNLQAK